MGVGLGCGHPPVRDATRVAVGADGWVSVDLGSLKLELPAEALARVDLRWRRGDTSGAHERATLRLGGAPLGATLDALADDEAAALRALDPHTPVAIVRTRWLGVEARLVRAGERSVLLAMRNPWRVARLFVRGRGAERLAQRGPFDLAGVRLDPRGWTYAGGRFEADTFVIRCARSCRVEPRRGVDPADADRVRRRVVRSVRAHPDGRR